MSTAARRTAIRARFGAGSRPVGAAARAFLIAGSLTASLSAPAGLRSQEAGPGTALNKADVVRILSGTTYAPPEVVQIIRRNCLAFEPTAQDMEHFRTLGADDRITAEIEACRSAEVARSEPDASPAGEGSGGVSSEPPGTTGSRDDARVPARAEVTPDPIPRSRKSDPGTTVKVRLLDRSGRSLPGRKFRLRADSPSGPALAEGVTDGAGNAEVLLPGDLPPDAERVIVDVGGKALAEFGVANGSTADPVVRFISGTGQAAEPGRPLPEPLVLEVLDASGAPLEGVPVRFAAEGGSVRPAVTASDSVGRVSVWLTPDLDGGPAAVIATVEGHSIRSDTAVRAAAVETADAVEMTESEFRDGLSQAARLLAVGDARAAEEAYRRLIEADSTNIDALVGHGRALQVLGDRARAADRYRQALALDPDRADARFWLDGLREGA